MTRKIAILGGGGGSLIAAWELVRTDPSAYDITVYQMGWRLGGKGASGRRVHDGNGPQDSRIEEHGLHLMFGFYENVFRVVREAYSEYYGDDTTWQSFFKTDDTAVAMVHFTDADRTTWEAWKVPYPRDDSGRLPGDPNEDGAGDGAVCTMVRDIWNWIRGVIEIGASTQSVDAVSLFGPRVPAVDPGVVHLHDLRAWIDALRHPVAPTDPTAPLQLMAPLENAALSFWDTCTSFVDRFAGRVPERDAIAADIARFEQLLKYAVGLAEAWSPAAIAALVRFFSAVARGLFTDLVVRGSDDWFALDRYDLREWLARHGGDPDAPPVQGLYDAVFASYSQLGAGAILQAALKAAFRFRGGAMYKMQAGMGDAIFAPLYLALLKKGVKFRFFHRVERLVTSGDGHLVERIDFERQVAGAEGYDPLIDVQASIGGRGSLKCWPSEPVWSRLPPAEVDRIKGRVDLESGFTPPPPAERRTSLQRGTDFTEVILGISVAALPELCGELLARDPLWKHHVDVLSQATTATQGMQLWTTQGKKPQQPNPIVVPFVEPYDTIADMSQLLAVETWPAGTVGGVHYLCSAISESSPPPGRDDAAYPDALLRAAREQGLAWVTDKATILWPGARLPGGGFDWSVLHDPAGAQGPARFDAQWVSTPTNLSDRYVIATPDSYGARLLSNGTTFLNLYLAGDWIKTSLSIGCFEATAMSGIQAARAVAMETGGAEVPRARGDWIEDVTPRSAAGVAPPRGPARFRQRDGELLSPPPYQVRCTDLFMFVLPADEGRLRAICDNELNLGPRTYSPLGKFVVLYAAGLQDLSMGITCNAREVGIWMPVAAKVNGVSSLRMYTPYVWLSSAASTIAGRSVFGYPKQTSDVVLPVDGGPMTVQVAAEAVVPGASSGPVITPRRPIVSASPPEPRTWQTPKDDLKSGAALAELFARVALEYVTFDPLASCEELVSSMGGMRCVFLKQLPGASSDVPSYQAIVEATLKPTLGSMAGAGLPGRWTVSIPDYQSPRMVDTLGLRATWTEGPDGGRVATVTPVGQTWMKFDGALGAGEEIWRAGV
jgi:uncharacterized protein with NAD-binding domain and iron-sulfur cluster